MNAWRTHLPWLLALMPVVATAFALEGAKGLSRGPFFPLTLHEKEGISVDGRRTSRCASAQHASTEIEQPNMLAAKNAAPVDRRNLANVTDTNNDDGNVLHRVKTADVMSLESIRSTLIRQEETIIFALIERSQFRTNDVVYKPFGVGGIGVPPGSSGFDNDESVPLSFLEYILISTEALHSLVRRYTSPEEHSFFPQHLPDKLLLPQLDYPPEILSSIGRACDLNFNGAILRRYIDKIVPSITQRGDDEQHGSSVICDVNVLQALSRRIHYGKFVAERKYRDNPAGFQALVDAGDAEGVLALLTDEAVERKIIRRVRLKSSNYGREPLQLPQMGAKGEVSVDEVAAAAAATAVHAALEAMRNNEGNIECGKVDPAAIEAIYRDIVIPLTKDVEVAYLFLRCGRQIPPGSYNPEAHLKAYEWLAAAKNM